MKKTIIFAGLVLSSILPVLAVPCAKSKAANEGDKNGQLTGDHVEATVDANNNPIPAYCVQTWCPPYHTGECQEDSGSKQQCSATTTYKPCKSYTVVGNSCESGPNNADTSTSHPDATNSGSVADVKITLKDCSTI